MFNLCHFVVVWVPSAYVAFDVSTTRTFVITMFWTFSAILIGLFTVEVSIFIDMFCESISIDMFCESISIDIF